MMETSWEAESKAGCMFDSSKITLGFLRVAFREDLTPVPGGLVIPWFELELLGLLVKNYEMFLISLVPLRD